MAEFLILTLGSLSALLLWLAIVALLARPFGVRLPLLPLFKSWERQAILRPVTLRQYVWFIGVLGWGGGMLISTTLWDYLEWKYWNGSSHDLSAGRMIFHAVFWVIGGLLFGWISSLGRSGKSTG